MSIPLCCSTDPLKMSLITATPLKDCQLFDASKLSASAPKKNGSGTGQQVYLNYGNGRVRIQAPRMSLAYDAKDYQGNEKYKTDLSFAGADSNPKVAAYQAMIEAIDSFVIETATANSAAWFGAGKAKSRDVVESMYTPSIKVSKKDYPSTHQVALRKYDGKWESELYDSKNNEMRDTTPLDVLKRGTEVTAIVEVTGIWIISGRFGLTWKLSQARIDVPGAGSASRGFLGMDEDTTAAGVSSAEEKDLLAAVLPAEEEEGEEEQEEEEEEIVAPPPVPAKKAAAVKKSVPIKKAGTKA